MSISYYKIVQKYKLKERFGYEPKFPEQWCIYKDKILIVCHPDKKPKYIFEDGLIKEFEWSDD